MGKQTIAEFVTAKEIADLLLASGVDHAQGYHFGRPRPINEIPPATDVTRSTPRAGDSYGARQPTSHEPAKRR